MFIICIHGYLLIYYAFCNYVFYNYVFYHLNENKSMISSLIIYYQLI